MYMDLPYDLSKCAFNFENKEMAETVFFETSIVLPSLSQRLHPDKKAIKFTDTLSRAGLLMRYLKAAEYSSKLVLTLF